MLIKEKYTEYLDVISQRDSLVKAYAELDQENEELHEYITDLEKIIYSVFCGTEEEIVIIEDIDEEDWENEYIIDNLEAIIVSLGAKMRR